MLKTLLPLIPLLLLSGCLFGGSDEQSTAGPVSKQTVRPGTYRGEYGRIAQAMIGLESELILDSTGRFRYFYLRDNTPFAVSKGNWAASNEALILSGAVLSYAYEDDGMDFDQWDSVSADSFYVRPISDGVFERLEPVPDTMGRWSARWVRYAPHPPPAPLMDGRYEYNESYTDFFDTARVFAGTQFIEIKRGGVYRDGRTIDGVPSYEFEGADWIQSGSFLITWNNRGRGYDSSSKLFDPWTVYKDDFEFITRVADVSADSFHSWMTSTASFKGSEHWGTYRRVP